MLVLARGGPPGTPRRLEAPFLRHETLAVLPGGATPRNPPLAQGPVPPSRDLGRAARGGDPPEPPAGSRPRSSVTRPWPCCPGGRPPGTPRWLKAPFLRHETLAVLPGGATPLEPPLAQGPVPPSRDLGRAARGGDPPGTPRCLKAPFLRHEALAVLARRGALPNPGYPGGGQVLSRIRRELRCGVDGAKPGR